MKFLNKFILAAAAVASLTLAGCGEDTPDYTHMDSKDVDFTYNVEGDEYTLDYYVVSRIQFNNTSSKSGAVSWDFGDGSTSTEPNPVHKFTKAGVYRVTLTVDGVGKQTYPILIYDIVPVLSIAEQDTEIIEFNKTNVSFNLELPNPENLKVKYVWKFPEGTLDENGNVIETFTGYSDAQGNVEYPGKLHFRNIGSQRIEISSWFDVDGENRRLEDTYLNVQVGLTEPAATLYYAQRGGTIKAYKLVDPATLPKGTKLLPYDLGVSAGNTVMELQYADVNGTDAEGNDAKVGWVYILDAGKQYYYINDENGVMGDGYINAMRTDGTNVNTVITNVGGPAFADPFQGCVVGDYLYYTDRNTGFSRIELTARGEVQGKTLQGSTYLRDSYIAKNELIPFYGRPLAYGAINSSLCRDSKGYWWMAKIYNGAGIYRFKDSDIYKTQDEGAAVPVPSVVLLNGGKPRAIALDESRNALYVWRTDGTTPGFYHYNLPGINEGIELSAKGVFSKAMSADPVNTTADEGLFTTQLAVDKETGYVYFAFRPTATDDSKLAAGICYYDPATKKVQHFGDGTDAGTGVCINPNKTKLF